MGRLGTRLPKAVGGSGMWQLSSWSLNEKLQKRGSQRLETRTLQSRDSPFIANFRNGGKFHFFLQLFYLPWPFSLYTRPIPNYFRLLTYLIRFYFHVISVPSVGLEFITLRWESHAPPTEPARHPDFWLFLKKSSSLCLNYWIQCADRSERKFKVMSLEGELRCPDLLLTSASKGIMGAKSSRPCSWLSGKTAYMWRVPVYLQKGLYLIMSEIPSSSSSLWLEVPF